MVDVEDDVIKFNKSESSPKAVEKPKGIQRSFSQPEFGDQVLTDLGHK